MKVLSSSIGKKFLMGITGLLLCGFLAVHLSGNLLLFASSDAYNRYAHTLHAREELLLIAEVGLFALFVVHIVLAFQTARINNRGRQVSYAMKETKILDRNLVAPLSPENWMVWSGIVVLGFLVLHLADFTFELRLRGSESEEPFDKAVRLLKDPISATVYVLGSIVLGFHVSHGVYSAFRSLGATHPKYSGFIKWFGVVFAVAIAIGFASFPFWAAFRNE